MVRAWRVAISSVFLAMFVSFVPIWVTNAPVIPELSAAAWPPSNAILLDAIAASVATSAFVIVSSSIFADVTASLAICADVTALASMSAVATVSLYAKAFRSVVRAWRVVIAFALLVILVLWSLTLVVRLVMLVSCASTLPSRVLMAVSFASTLPVRAVTPSPSTFPLT